MTETSDGTSNVPATSDSGVSHKRYYVYVLVSLKDKGFYIGFTQDLKKRITQHTRAAVVSTKNRLPVKMIHYEYFINDADAKAREVFLKSGFGRAQLKQILKRTTGLF